jgi:hypothetical protein
VLGADLAGQALALAMSHGDAVVHRDPKGNCQDIGLKMAECGYCVETYILNAKDCTLPQERVRIYWVCFSLDKFGTRADSIIANTTTCLKSIKGNVEMVALDDIFLPSSSLAVMAHREHMEATDCKKWRMDAKWVALHKTMYQAQGLTWQEPTRMGVGNRPPRECCLLRYIALTVQQGTPYYQAIARSGEAFADLPGARSLLPSHFL